MYTSALIDNLLLEHRIFPNKKGYAYLKAFIKYRMENESYLFKDVYILVADNFGVKPNSVEKSISNVIESSFGHYEIAEKYGSLVDAEKGKLSNKLFLRILLDEIHKKMM